MNDYTKLHTLIFETEIAEHQLITAQADLTILRPQLDEASMQAFGKPYADLTAADHALIALGYDDNDLRELRLLDETMPVGLSMDGMPGLSTPDGLAPEGEICQACGGYADPRIRCGYCTFHVEQKAQASLAQAQTPGTGENH